MRLTRTARLGLTAQGALVGLAAGTLIAAYRFCLSHAEQALRLITPWLAERGLYLVWFAVLALIMVVVGTLMLREPDTQGSGIPQLSAEVADRIDMRWQRVLPIKFVEGVLLAVSGLSLGREGPSVLLGAMSAKAVSRGLRQPRQRERLLATCGAAAGMSAAFHAPLTGILFALEEVHKSFAAPLIISVMAASVVADFASAMVLGANPTIHFISFSQLPLELYATVLVMGVISGVAGAIHNKGMFFVQELFDRITTHVPYARLAIPFTLAGVCAFLAPDLMCGGDAIIEHVISARGESIAFLATLLVGKFVFTCICFGSGAPGGTLLPLVVLGSLIGGITGLAASTAAGISAASAATASGSSVAKP
jgi:H+/Cl- antiporter ClcA